jgi:UDP-N-acetylmuramyl pentapeptide synthase
LVGRRARDVADILITVGKLGRIIGLEALAAGMPTQCVHFMDTNAAAVELLRGIIGSAPGADRILVKGSRALGMDGIVAALTQPGKAGYQGMERRKS